MTLYKKIKLIAKQVENNVNTKKKLPIVKGYNWRQYSYLLAKSITKPYVDITSKSVGKARNQKGTKINKKIYKKDYLQLAKNLIAFVDKYGYLPNHLKYGTYKIRPVLYTYMFAKIVNYMAKNKEYPAYVTVDSNVFVVQTFKKYGHATEYGCDNKGQNNGYYCGCHSLQEVFRNLTGKVVPQSTIASVAGTTTDGTDHEGLNTAVAWFSKTYGYDLSVQWKDFSDLGWSGVKKIINSTNQDCVIHNLYRNQWGHYEVINSIEDDSIIVQNSLGDKCTSSCYCGYEEDRSPSTFRSYINGISQKSVMIITRK